MLRIGGRPVLSRGLLAAAELDVPQRRSEPFDWITYPAPLGQNGWGCPLELFNPLGRGHLAQPIHHGRQIA
jgi:hypothetical protein